MQTSTTDVNVKPAFFLAHLTIWGLIVTTVYIILSALSAVYLAMRPPARLADLLGGAGVLIKSTWALFAIAAPAELVITILYYVLKFPGTFNYSDQMLHGIVMILIIVDGFILIRIPLHMKQFVLFESFMTIYFLWTIAHAYSNIGNPFANGKTPTKDDDAIFSSLNWKKRTTQASIFAMP